MSTGSRRGVTRGYVWGLICATLVIAVALVVASWGLITLFTDRLPVQTPGVPMTVASILIIVALGLLAWGLWLQALELLRGLRTPPWAHTLTLAGGAYLVWSLGGLLAGLSVDDTWVSPFALTLALVWAVASLLCCAQSGLSPLCCSS